MLQEILMNIFVIGPLLFGIGYKNPNESMYLYNYLTFLTILMPFLIKIPFYDIEKWDVIEYKNVFKLLVLFPFLGYISFKKDRTPQIYFHLIKIFALIIIIFNCYLIIEKIIKKLKEIKLI